MLCWSPDEDAAQICEQYEAVQQLSDEEARGMLGQTLQFEDLLTTRVFTNSVYVWYPGTDCMVLMAVFLKGVVKADVRKALKGKHGRDRSSSCTEATPGKQLPLLWPTRFRVVWDGPWQRRTGVGLSRLRTVANRHSSRPSMASCKEQESNR